jgi:predicted protein tyrosine phosphatase
MGTMNRIGNAASPFQGQIKRVLCVCSAGLLRSPTAAVVLSQEPYNFNTRAVGISREYALIPLDIVHLHWADEIVTMEQDHTDIVLQRLSDCGLSPDSVTIIQLNLPDDFVYRDPELIRLIKERYDENNK